MRIDAHQHYWQLSRGDYGWLTPEAGLLYNNFLPSQLSPLLQQYGLTKSIVVQAASTIEETEYLLELCHKEASLAGVVGWLDLESDNFEKQLRYLMLHPYFLGLRPSLKTGGQKSLIASRKAMQSLEFIAKLEVPLDLLIVPEHLAEMIEVLEQIPHLRVVLDHLGNPDFAEQVLEPWCSELKRFSKFDKTYCKLSGMVTRINKERDIVTSMKPYVEHVLNCFGTEKVMYGSDWPVCLLASSYEETISSFIEALPELTEIQFNNIFGLNAQRFYKIRYGL